MKCEREIRATAHWKLEAYLFKLFLKSFPPSMWGVTNCNYPTETKVTLSVDQWYEASFAIEDREAAQVKHSYYIQEKYAKNCGYAVAKKLEVALASLFDNFSTTVGASTSVLVDSVIRAAIAGLEAVNIDTTEAVAFFLHPNVFWKQVQDVDKFSLAVNSPVNDPTGKTPKATLYGKLYAVVKSFLIKSGNSLENLYKLVCCDTIPVYAIQL